jgi:membrane protein required for colicin V production
MSALGLTIVDPLVIAVVLLSAVYATYRGFISETLSIFAWAAAAFATLFFGPKLAPYTRGWFASEMVGALVGYAAIFLVVLIPLSFASFRFSESVKHSPVSTLDRALGAAFGVARGLAVIGLAYIAFSAVISVKNQPHWIADAKLLPVIQGSSEVLLSLVPDQHNRDTAAAAQPAAQRQQPAKQANVPVPTPKPTQTATKRHGQKAYGAAERRQLDRLIDATANGGNGKP